MQLPWQMVLAMLFINPLWRFMVNWKVAIEYFIRKPKLVRIEILHLLNQLALMFALTIYYFRKNIYFIPLLELELAVTQNYRWPLLKTILFIIQETSPYEWWNKADEGCCVRKQLCLCFGHQLNTVASLHRLYFCLYIRLLNNLHGKWGAGKWKTVHETPHSSGTNCFNNLHGQGITSSYVANSFLSYISSSLETVHTWMAGSSESRSRWVPRILLGLKPLG